jgi:hypothetical protein
MFVQFNRTTISPLWLVVFGLLALLWSPLSVAMGVLLFLVGFAGPAVMLILWSGRSVTVAHEVPRVDGSKERGDARHMHRTPTCPRGRIPMGITRALALSTAWIVISTTSLSARPELSTYRGFQFGMSVVTVAGHAGISPEPRIIHQRPELIQELMWLPPRLGASADEGDSVQKILFTFYNDQLSRVVVSYDRSRTEGLTAEDLVEAISATYGVAAIPAVGMAPLTPGPNADDKIVAHWEDPQYSIVLFRSKYLSTFGLVLVSKRLDSLTTLANVEATLLDDREAPARETARQLRQTDEDRLREETVRRVNKTAFKP